MTVTHQPDVSIRERPSGLMQTICMRRGGLCVVGALAAIALLFIWQASLIDLGNIGLPGPGFFPLMMALLLFGLAIIIGIEGWRSRPTGETIELGHRDVLIVFAAMLVVPPLFEPLGALPTLGLFSAALLYLVARISLPLSIAASAAGMAACWFFFELLLGVQLPGGLLDMVTAP
jgi:hypothetical protein